MSWNQNNKTAEILDIYINTTYIFITHSNNLKMSRNACFGHFYKSLKNASYLFEIKT